MILLQTGPLSVDAASALLDRVQNDLPRLTLGASDAPASDAKRKDRPRYRRIVLGYDGSAGAKLALDWARDLACAHGASVTVVSAFTPPQVGNAFTMGFAWYPDYAQAYHDAERVVRASADSAVATLRTFDVEADELVEAASPVLAITDAAKARSADLIVVGATRGTRWAHALGSVAQALLSRAPCSVLVARGPSRPRKILVATDGSRVSHRAVAHALHRASETAAELVVQHVLEYPLAREDDVPPQGFVKSVVEHARLPAAPPRLRYVLDVGSPAARILARAAEEDAGLIVLGSHGKDAFERLVVGSTSRRVAADAHASVLVVQDVRP